MIIRVDEDGRSVIQQLCDIALKDGGISNLKQVNAILRSVTVLPTPQEETSGRNEPEKVPEEKPEEESKEELEKEPKEKPKEDEVGKN